MLHISRGKRSLYLACIRLIEKRKRNKLDNTVHCHNTYRNAIGANPRDLLINTTLIGKSKVPCDWHSYVAATLPFPVGYDRWTNYDDDELDACKFYHYRFATVLLRTFLYGRSVSFLLTHCRKTLEEEKGSLIKRFLFPNYR